MNIMKPIWAVLGLYILVQVLAAILPLVFGLSFSNASVYGTFGAAILPVVVPLLLSVAVLVLIIGGVMVLAGHKGGKGAGL